MGAPRRTKMAEGFVVVGVDVSPVVVCAAAAATAAAAAAATAAAGYGGKNSDYYRHRW